MTVREIQNILSAEVVCGGDCLDREVNDACGSDMMSDVLAFVKQQAVLLTGLVNPPVIRTAQRFFKPGDKKNRRDDGYEMRGFCAR